MAMILWARFLPLITTWTTQPWAWIFLRSFPAKNKKQKHLGRLNHRTRSQKKNNHKLNLIMISSTSRTWMIKYCRKINIQTKILKKPLKIFKLSIKYMEKSTTLWANVQETSGPKFKTLSSRTILLKKACLSRNLRRKNWKKSVNNIEQVRLN